MIWREHFQNLTKKLKNSARVFQWKVVFFYCLVFRYQLQDYFFKLIFEIMGFCEAVDVDKGPSSFLEPLQRN